MKFHRARGGLVRELIDVFLDLGRAVIGSRIGNHVLDPSTSVAPVSSLVLKFSAKGEIFT